MYREVFKTMVQLSERRIDRTHAHMLIPLVRIAAPESAMAGARDWLKEQNNYTVTLWNDQPIAVLCHVSVRPIASSPTVIRIVISGRSAALRSP